MSNVNAVPVTAPAAPATSYTDAAATLIDVVRGLKDQIPNFVVPESKGANQKLAKAASVPLTFINLAAVAIRNNGELARGGNTVQPQMLDLASYAEAFAPVADELEAMALFIRHSVQAARNKAGSEALTTYALAQRLAKRPETASLAPHVEDMRNALGSFGRKAKAKPAPAPAPGTSPSPTQSSPVTPSSPAPLPKQ
ncbi:MAG TPA: hypothetical protein VLC46_01290 [Thermoanaerobaculia bacterium]|jgi:hypothetical protein|nr:hypothetical protein [Thermoanaerobaculia bacterium]